MPFGAVPSPYLDIAVRSEMPVEQLTAILRHELRELDPKLALGTTKTLENIVDEDLAQSRLQAVLVALFACVALALATLGVYGVVSQSVRAQTAELGVRMALGATQAQVARSVLRQGLAAPIAGLIIGLGAAWAASRYLASMLYAVQPRDVRVFSAAALVLELASVASCALPALAASRVDPARVLRED